MTTFPLAGRSVVIIEDEALIALDLAQTFEAAGAQVTTTNSVHHAHVLVEHDGLSAAVVDQALPDGDTDELCRHLVKHDVPFVIYSGFNSKVLLAGVKAVYIPKPNTPELVVAAVERLLRSGAPSATSHAPTDDEAAFIENPQADNQEAVSEVLAAIQVCELACDVSEQPKSRD